MCIVRELEKHFGASVVGRTHILSQVEKSDRPSVCRLQELDLLIPVLIPVLISVVRRGVCFRMLGQKNELAIKMCAWGHAQWRMDHIANFARISVEIPALCLTIVRILLHAVCYH